MKKILFAASEALPYAASGGLGDVIGSLPAAIKQADKDCDIRVIMPLYGTMSAIRIFSFRFSLQEFLNLPQDRRLYLFQSW